MKLNLKTKIILFLLFLIFGFFDFISFLPETVRNDHLAEKFIIDKARAATVSYSIPWASSAEGFVWVLESCNGTCTQGFTAADGNPAGSMFARIVGRNKKSAGYWKKSLTWEDMGVPAGATVTGIDGRFDVKLAQETNAAAHLVGLKIFDSTDAITVLNGSVADVETGFDPSSSSWITRNVDGTKTINPAYQSSSTFVTIRMRESVNSGNSASASSEVRVDNAIFVITYTGPNATNFVNNTESALTDGGRSSQQITVTGIDFGAGPSNGTTNAIKIGTYIVPNGNVTTWNATMIVFTIPAAAAVYGGTGANGLTVRAGGIDDATPLDFYIYPNITSASTNSEQIGADITVSGDHLGASAGSININTKSATVVGAWSENSITLRIPGQEETINITGKIQITRSDSKTSNMFPSDPANFTILAPSVSSSTPASATSGQISVSIEFSGFGIDTDTGTSPAMKLIKSGESDIIGTGFSVVTAYQKISAVFDLSGAATGTWDLVITNDDSQSGTCNGCFTINPPSGPVVSGINPSFGLNSGVKNIISIAGSNFQNGATAKLTKTAQTPIDALPAFTFTDANTLSNGTFELTEKTLGFWNVVVTNPDLQTGSYGNESDSGFEIRSALPSNPANLSQSKTELGLSISEGGGIGGQLTVYLRMDMEGGSADNYTPEVEVKPYSTPLDGLTNIYSGTAVYCDPSGGIPAKGFVIFSGTDGESYHWRARVQNSSGTSGWTSFGIIPGPNDKDFYLDDTPPSISLIGGDCLTATTNITDLTSMIGWNTFDSASGAASPPGLETSYAYPQIQYIETFLFDSWTNPGYFFPSAPSWKDSPHQVALSGLSPDTSYTYRIISEDSVGNIGYSAVNCQFSTESSYPIKTIELFILQESVQNIGSRISKLFNVYIPESPGLNTVSVKSAFIEISGISSPGNQEIDAELQQSSNAYISPGTTYLIDSTGTTTPFTILFDTLNPAGNNQDMKNITDGGQSYDYTLYLNGNGIPVSVFSAKLIITYTYKP